MWHSLWRGDSHSPFVGLLSAHRIVLSTKSGDGQEANVLEPFFPFDPYNLQQSAAYVTNYVQWTTTEEPESDIMMLERYVLHSASLALMSSCTRLV